MAGKHPVRIGIVARQAIKRHRTRRSRQHDKTAPIVPTRPFHRLQSARAAYDRLVAARRIARQRVVTAGIKDHHRPRGAREHPADDLLRIDGVGAQLPFRRRRRGIDR